MNNNINKDLIKELRKRTGVSIIKCKQALVKSNSNIELAIENIRKLGLQVDLNRSQRSVSSGLIITKISSDCKIGLIIEVTCDTDFVARNHIFQEFVRYTVTVALNESINNIDTLRNRVEQETRILIHKVNENININKFIVLRGNFLCDYVHGSKIGAIISVSGKINKYIIKHIVMHIVAKNPKYIYTSNVPTEVMVREHQIQTDIAVKFAKSSQILNNIVKGRVDKFLNECVLTKQDFIMDSNKTVGEILDEYCIKIDDFVRFEIGNNY